MRGRVNGLAGAGFSTVTAAAFLLSGAVADLATPAVAVTVAAVLGLALVGVAHRTWPHGRAAADRDPGLPAGRLTPARHRHARIGHLAAFTGAARRLVRHTGPGSRRHPSRRPHTRKSRTHAPCPPYPPTCSLAAVGHGRPGGDAARRRSPARGQDREDRQPPVRRARHGPGRRLLADRQDRLDAAVGRGRRPGPTSRRRPGVYDFRRLDQIVVEAHAHGTELTLVLGMTPDFYQPAGGSIASMPTDLDAWSNYVRALVQPLQRGDWGYRGIAAYQVWNEANVKNFWTGSPAQMAQLTRITYAAVKARRPRRPGDRPGVRRPDRRADPRASASSTTTGSRTTGRRCGSYMDAISLNLYPKAFYGAKAGTPEKSMELLAAARKPDAAARRPGQQADLEHRDQLRPASPAAPAASSAISDERRRRTSSAPTCSTPPTASSGCTGTPGTQPEPGQHQDDQRQHRRRPRWPARRSTSRSRGCPAASWSVPARSAQPCAKDRAGTYTCVIKYAEGVRRVYWNPTK